MVSFVYMVYNLLVKTPCRQVALPVKYLFLKYQKNMEWSQNPAPHMIFFIDHLQKIMQKQHLSLNSSCKKWKTDNNKTSWSNSGSQEKLPFLCLLTAARWRNKTLLSRRQYKLRVKEFHCKLMQVQLQILLWSLCHIYFSTMRFSWKVVCHWICLNLQMSK